MIKRAGGMKIKGKSYFWTNFYIDEISLNEPLFKIASYTVPVDWLAEMFDERLSAYLMAMPPENWN